MADERTNHSATSGTESEPTGVVRAERPVFRDEALAPEVDRNLLLALVRRELPTETARAVFRLVHSFKSWNEARTEILIEEFRRTQGPG